MEEAIFFLLANEKQNVFIVIKVVVIKFCFKLLQRFLLEGVSNSFNRGVDLTKAVKPK